jgi:hypothetical protein
MHEVNLIIRSSLTCPNPFYFVSFYDTIQLIPCLFWYTSIAASMGGLQRKRPPPQFSSRSKTNHKGHKDKFQYFVGHPFLHLYNFNIRCIYNFNIRCIYSIFRVQTVLEITKKLICQVV